MKIDNSITPASGTQAVRTVRDSKPASSHDADDAAGAPPSAPSRDSAQFSAEGLALANGTSLSPARVAQFRRNITDGIYNAPHVAERVATSILKSGDL